MEAIVHIQNIRKTYPEFQLQDISLTIPKGVIMGFIGENGAGKTTTIKAILDMISLEQGSIQIFGKDSHKEGKQIRQDIGVVLSESNFPEYMTPKQIERVLSSIYERWDSALYYDLLKQFSLSSEKKIKELSRGMQRKLSIAMAMSHHPKFLILDEATSGLDPIVRDEILEVFQSFIEDEEHSIFLSSHITSDIEKIADYVTFIHKGKIVLSEPKDELLESYGILKTTPQDFTMLSEDEYIAYRKTAYSFEVLINNKSQVQRKLPDAVIDSPTLEDIMLFTVKGER